VVGFNSTADSPKQILVITIRAFPPNTNPKYAGRRGAIFQFEAPFLTLESLQGQEHPAGAWRELQLLIERLDTLGTKLIPVDFTFPLADAPLSWHLRACDKKKLKDGWFGTLVERFLTSAPLSEINWPTVYASGPKGYIDYPTLLTTLSDS